MSQWNDIDPASKRFEPIPTTLFSTHFRSKTEARVAWFLTGMGLDWEYEPGRFPVGYPGFTAVYTPDIYLPELDLWIEVKGVMDTPDMNRILKGVDTSGQHLPTTWRGSPHVMVINKLPWPGTRTMWPVLYCDAMGRVRWDWYTFDPLEGIRFVDHGQILSGRTLPRYLTKANHPEPGWVETISPDTDFPYQGRGMAGYESYALKCRFTNWWVPQIQHSIYRALSKEDTGWWETLKYAGLEHAERLERIPSFA